MKTVVTLSARKVVRPPQGAGPDYVVRAEIEGGYSPHYFPVKASGLLPAFVLVFAQVQDIFPHLDLTLVTK